MFAGCGHVLKLRAAGWSYADLQKRKVPEDVLKRVQDIETGILRNRHDKFSLRQVNIHIDNLENYMKNSA